MELANTLRKRSLSVRTRNGAVEERTADDGELVGEPVSPSARLVEGCFIVVHLGLAAPVNPSAWRTGINAKIASHPRFNRIQTRDEDGVLRWVRTTVDLDHHIIYPRLELDTAANPDQAVEDYVASLPNKPMDHSRPLWEFHVLDFPTSEATATVVMRVHHSLSDGTSLLMLLLSSTRSAADPTKPPAMPPLPARSGPIYSRPRPPLSAGALAFGMWVCSFVLLAWHTVWDVASFSAIILFRKDTHTLFTRMNHDDCQRKRIVHTSLSLDDVKFVKDAINCTVNDVLVGVTDAALSRYYYRKSEICKDIRLRSILLVNLRAPTALHACVNMIESGKGSVVKWGNQIGFIILPVHIAMHSDPLDYIRKAKNIVDMKKNSLEAVSTYMVAEVFHKIFGWKAGAAIIHRMVSHTTMCLSNMIGPVEQVEFFGHPVAFIAPSQHGIAQAINVNYQSYVNTVRVVLAVDEAQFPDCYDLLEDFSESLKRIKGAAMSVGQHN
ncbi:hypothetical protein CFC21_031868 [Triticum aestivum]|uniref:Uncharacterized protein n=2 Tax=Triticum aestivum TaxID=4565 RepID=A0A3B6U9K8_WHEAT|nr:wax ester synthase/diacylglycerol acyltransferase 5-like isoform X2 [Triticum aestivum]KAF7018590.1 hypothetical protein CFC21_031868 [Triticum aestivum]